MSCLKNRKKYISEKQVCHRLVALSVLRTPRTNLLPPPLCSAGNRVCDKVWLGLPQPIPLLYFLTVFTLTWAFFGYFWPALNRLEQTASVRRKYCLI